MQSLNLDLETKTIPKGNFLLDCRRTEEYLLINYSYLFPVNQRPDPSPSGVEHEKDFRKVPIQRLEGNLYSFAAISHIWIQS